jgi:hypothetical protein
MLLTRGFKRILITDFGFFFFLKTDIANIWSLSIVNDTGNQLFAGITDTGKKTGRL